MINPLDSAISGIAKALAETESLTALILQDHLSRLCEMQRQGLGGTLEDCKRRFGGGDIPFDRVAGAPLRS